MGIGVRVLFFEEGGGIKKVSYARFERLISGNPKEVIREYAGKRVRCAMTFVELDDRKPVKIRHTDFMILPFARDGALDRQDYGRGASLVVNSLDFGKSQTGNAVNLAPKFSRERYLREFTWEPTQEDIRAIVNDALPTRGR